MNKSVVITGEAPETDSEDEEVASPVKSVKGVQGAVVSGEDSESEEESGSVASAISVLTLTKISQPSDGKNSNSLLHRKLRECNGQLHVDTETFCQNFINEATKSLNSVDQQLLKSQNVLQSAVTSLKSLNVTSAAVKNKLHSLLVDNFIQNISTNQK